MTTLSICMIVRNEATILPDFLYAAQGLYQELCVVDTGSTDGTQRLLRDAGAKVVEMAWEGDFAKARNASLRMATSEWILVLDADELVNQDFKESVAQLLQQPNAGAATIPIRNMLDNDRGVMSYLMRLFRNDQAIQYTHSIHEDNTDSLFDYIKRTGRTIAAVAGVVEHLGYVRERASSRNKQARDTGILQAALKKNPDDLYGWYKLMEQARFWDDSQMASEMAPLALEALQCADPAFLQQAHFAGELLVMIAAGLYPESHKPALLFLYPDSPQEALDFLAPWASRIKPSAAYFLRCGELRELIGGTPMWQAASQDFDACLGLRACTANRQLSTVRPLLGLSRVALASGEMDEALRFLRLALSEDPRDAEALLAMATLSHQAGGQQASSDVKAAYLQSYGDTAELHGAFGEAALRAGDTQAAVSELQLAVGKQASQSPYADLLDEALLAAL